MKKKVVVYLMAAVMALGFAGCGNNVQTENTDGGKNSSEGQSLKEEGGADVEDMTFDEL